MVQDSARTSEDDRPIRAERRRDTMLDAAEGLFITQGYAGTSLAEIVRLSGGSLATLYDIFGNKQGLLHALAIRWRDETKAERAARGEGAGGSNRDVLMGYVRSECAVWQSPRATGLIRILVSEGLRDRNFAIQTYRDLHAPFVAEITNLFVEWSEVGTASIDDPETAAHLFISTISGDTLLGRIFGVKDATLDIAQIANRLEPFFHYYEIS